MGREAEVSVLFSDIRSFTAFSERALPYDVIHILNRYFDTIGASIDTHGGYIDKYMGDGIMVIFGLDQNAGSGHARQAVNAARSIVQALPGFNHYVRTNLNHEFEIGMGIHSGNVILGSLGFHKKKEYTALGDTVNMASRIEAYNKISGTTILCSDRTRELAGDGFRWRRQFAAEVKGKEEPLSVHELLG